MADQLFLTLVKMRKADLETVRKDLQSNGLKTPYLDSAIKVMEQELLTQEIASTPVPR